MGEAPQVQTLDLAQRFSSITHTQATETEEREDRQRERENKYNHVLKPFGVGFLNDFFFFFSLSSVFGFLSFPFFFFFQRKQIKIDRRCVMFAKRKQREVRKQKQRLQRKRRRTERQNHETLYANSAGNGTDLGLLEFGL